MHTFMVAVFIPAGSAARVGAREISASPVTVAFLLLMALGGLAVWFLAPRARRGHEDEDGDPGSGGGGGRRPPERPPSPGGDPVWWAEFERQFAAYLVSRPQHVHAARRVKTPVSGFPYPGAFVKRR